MPGVTINAGTAGWLKHGGTERGGEGLRSPKASQTELGVPIRVEVPGVGE